MVPTLVNVPATELHWPFEDGGPRYDLRVGEWSETVKVDPFPCYSHDLKLAQQMVDKVGQLFPIGFPVTFYILSHEGVGRTNGYWSRQWGEYDPETKRWTRWDSYVVLFGKRIPPHPAMTRYLVSHEYGHAVHRWIEHVRNDDPHSNPSEFVKEYAALRGIAPDDSYGALRWHSNIGELIANDFRICVTDVETEFWPHPGFKRPEELPEIQGFWRDTTERLAARN